MDEKTKQNLHELCLQLVMQRIHTAKAAMNAAQEAANNEGKSSAGDKYETGRAMMQIERDQHARLLSEAIKLKQALDAIDPQRPHERIQMGSLAVTSEARYFLSVSLGKIIVDDEEWIALSPLTPLGSALLGKSAGETAIFMQKEMKILKVY